MSRRSFPLRAGSVIALVLVLAFTFGATLATRASIAAQEHRLLKERSAEVGLVLTQAIETVQTALRQQGAVLDATGKSASAYEQSAAKAVATEPGHVTYAWLERTTPGRFTVIATAGGALRAGQEIADERAATLQRALETRAMVPSPVIGPRRLIGFALGPPAAPDGTVLYRESALGPVVAPPRAASSAPFSELDVALYSTKTQVPAQVVVATTPKLPLHGEVRNSMIPAGASQWLLTVKARVPLVGTLTANAPWFTLAVGIVGSLLVAVVVETAARRRDAALALYESEHHIAETLQRSLLPELPKIPGLDLAARYLASAAGQHVGGDWFDVFPVSDDRVGIVTGDVIGHDLYAATAMAQIRALVRGYGIDGDDPAAVMTRLDRVVERLRLTELVTVFYGVLDVPAADGSRRLRYSNAGHVPPMLRDAGGAVAPLSGGESLLIGAPGDPDHVQSEHVLAEGSTLVLFTDGLVEVPGSSLTDSLQELATTIGAQREETADQLCTRLLEHTPDGARRDDIALLVVRLAGCR